MGFDDDGFVLNVSWKAKGSWLSPGLAEALLAPLAAHVARADRIVINGGDDEPIGDLAARARAWGHDTVMISEGDVGDPAWFVTLELDARKPAIGLGFAGARATDALRADTQAWVATWAALLGAAGATFRHGQLSRTQPDYPRPKRPRESDVWLLGSLDQYEGVTWHRDEPARAAVLARLEAAPLPAGATRTLAGDVLRISFAAALTDRAAVAAARAAHERWLTPLVPTTPELGWNDAGDRAVVPARPVARDPLTLYDEKEHVGYKALVVYPDTDEVDEDQWAAARQVLDRKALPDGTPVGSVRLIFPSRDDALRLLPRARAEGFEMATYPEGAIFWQVDPAD